MEKDENREPQKDEEEGSEDLEVGGKEAEEVAGGRKAGGGQQDYGLPNE